MSQKNPMVDPFCVSFRHYLHIVLLSIVYLSISLEVYIWDQITSDIFFCFCFVFMFSFSSSLIFCRTWVSYFIKCINVIILTWGQIYSSLLSVLSKGELKKLLCQLHPSSIFLYLILMGFWMKKKSFQLYALFPRYLGVLFFFCKVFVKVFLSKCTKSPMVLSFIFQL